MYILVLESNEFFFGLFTSQLIHFSFPNSLKLYIFARICDCASGGPATLRLVVTIVQTEKSLFREFLNMSRGESNPDAKVYVGDLDPRADKREVEEPFAKIGPLK